MKRTLGIIFSNIHDAELGELTKKRTLASLPFGGRYRQIDFVLSNMVNSNIYEVGVVAKYNYQSLMDHLSKSSSWDLNRKNTGLFILPPFALGQHDVYGSKIDALFGAIDFLKKSQMDYVVMSDSNVLCNINYEAAIDEHIEMGNDITIIGTKVKTGKEKQSLVVMADSSRVVDIAIDVPCKKDACCGMNMYIIEKNFLIKIIEDATSHGFTNFERELLQRGFLQDELKVGFYEYKGITLRNNSVSSYFDNNMALLKQEVREELFCDESPIYTKVRDEVPTFYGKNSTVDDCIIAGGCTISGTVKKSIIFRGVTIEEGAIVTNSVVMQGSIIKKGTKINNAIVDKDCVITENRTLSGGAKQPFIIKKGEVI
ncbi:MAG: glucose-1-phosphate adenylyltransferase subunit GlgD [Oscillospiraceae bacterium]